MSKEFTVIASIADEGTLVVRHVLASDPYHAFGVVAKEEQDKGDDGLQLEFLVTLNGWQKDGVAFTLPGEGIVCAETVLEQDDVFGPGETESTSTNAQRG